MSWEIVRRRAPEGCVSASRLTTAAGPRAATSGWLTPRCFHDGLQRLCDKSEGETCHVERWNCTLRQRLGRFVHKTLSFSKCDRMHELALRLFIHGTTNNPSFH